jgi:TetR/AcrR family transcriptional repressor of nem operon
MKVTREKSAAHRAAIVKAAADLFRTRGVDGVGVAEIMQAAGLTHGGFYGHFASKDALVAEACGLAFNEGVERVARDTDLAGYVTRYMSLLHRDRSLGGCPMAALGGEIERQDEAVQENFTDGVARYLASVEDLLRRSSDLTPEQARIQAIGTVATLVGGMVLARATAQAQPDLSAEILRALPEAILN